MRYAETIPEKKRSRLPLIAAALAASSACSGLRRAPEAPLDVLVIPAAALGIALDDDTARTKAMGGSWTGVSSVFRVDVPTAGGWVADRAMLSSPGAGERHAAIVTFGGSERDPADVLRVLDADTTGRSRAAAAVAAAARTDRADLLILALRGATVRDRAALVDLFATLAGAARRAGVRGVGVLLDAADTSAYPTRELARALDFLLVRVEPAAPPPRPRALLRADELRRALGLRASEAGVRRTVALLPLYGMLWTRDSLPQLISYRAATDLARAWLTPLSRDAASGYLFARDGERAEVWVPDATTIRTLVDEARSMGIDRFALVVSGGDDERIWQLFAPTP